MQMEFNFTENFLDEERLKFRCSVLELESLKSVKIVSNNLVKVEQLTNVSPAKFNFEHQIVEVRNIITTLALQKKEVVRFYLQARNLFLSMSLFVAEVVCFVYKFKILRIIDRFFWCLKKLLFIGCDLFDLQQKLLESFSYVYMRKEKGSSVFVINKRKTNLNFNSRKAKSYLKIKNLLFFEKNFFIFLSITELIIAHFNNVKEMFPVSDYWVLLFKIEGVSLKKKQKLEKKEALLKTLLNVYCLIISVHLDLFLKFLKLFASNVYEFSTKNKRSDFAEFELRVKVLEKNVKNFFSFFDKFFYLVYQEYFVLSFFKTAMFSQGEDSSILRKKNLQKVYLVEDLDFEKNPQDENTESAIFREVKKQRKKKIKKEERKKVLWSPKALAWRKAQADYAERLKTKRESKVEPKPQVVSFVEVESPVEIEPLVEGNSDVKVDPQLALKSKSNQVFKRSSKKKIEQASDIPKFETKLNSKVKSKQNFEGKSKSKSEVISKKKAKLKLKKKLPSTLGLKSKNKLELKSKSELKSKPDFTSKVKLKVSSPLKIQSKVGLKSKLGLTSKLKSEAKSNSAVKSKSKDKSKDKTKPKIEVNSTFVDDKKHFVPVLPESKPKKKRKPKLKTKTKIISKKLETKSEKRVKSKGKKRK